MRVQTITQHYVYLDDNEKWIVEYSEGGRDYRFTASLIHPYALNSYHVSGPALSSKGNKLLVNRSRILDAKDIPADILAGIPKDND